MRDPSQATPPDEIGLRDETRDPSLPSRRYLSGLDAFWPVLAVVLVVAVIFVASVAHSSMDGVGVPVSQIEAATPPQPTSKSGPILIVQISSHATRAVALDAVKELKDKGFAAKVLKSDNFRPLNRGYYVVFAGPYPTSAAGRAEAKQVQAQISGALVREIQRRDDTTTSK